MAQIINGKLADVLSQVQLVVLVDSSGNSIDSVGGGSYTGTLPIVVSGNTISLSYTQINYEKPSGNIDGVNKNFTLLHAPLNNSTMVYENGIKLMPSGVYPEWDYTINMNNLDLTYAPVSGTKIFVDYQF